MHATNTQTSGSHTPHGVVKPAIRQVGIVVSDGFSLLGVGMVLEVFRLAHGIAEAVPGDGRAHDVTYQVQMLSGDGGTVTSSGAVRIWTRAVDDFMRESAGELLVANSFEHEPHEWVRGALTIVLKDFDATVAREIARHLLPGADDRLLPASSDMDTVKHKVRRGAQWLAANCGRPVTIEDAAAEAAMSRRNFLRKFRLEMGSTPSEFLLQARLGMASRLLAQTELPVDKIARRCAMGNGDNLAKIFRKRWSISPTEYRSRQRSQKSLIAGGAAHHDLSDECLAGLSM